MSSPLLLHYIIDMGLLVPFHDYVDLISFLPFYSIVAELKNDFFDYVGVSKLLKEGTQKGEFEAMFVPMPIDPPPRPS